MGLEYLYKKLRQRENRKILLKAGWTGKEIEELYIYAGDICVTTSKGCSV